MPTPIPQIEQILLHSLQRIHYWADYAGSIPSPEAPLLRANERFRRQLLRYAATEPATLRAEFLQLPVQRHRVREA